MQPDLQPERAREKKVNRLVRQGLLILGLGGHARSAADLALSSGYDSLLFVDDNAAEGELVLGFATQREFKGPLPAGWSCLPASGNNRRRHLQVRSAQDAGWPLATLVSSHASIGVGSLISPGCFIGHHAHVGPMARIGTACILNTGAVVEHECMIGNFVHISVNTTVAGRCRVGDFVFLGAGATVIDGTAIAANVTVGAGGVVTESIDLPGTYVGVPARLLIDSK